MNLEENTFEDALTDEELSKIFLQYTELLDNLFNPIKNNLNLKLIILNIYTKKLIHPDWSIGIEQITELLEEYEEKEKIKD